MKKKERKIIFIEDEIDLKILQFTRKFSFLRNYDFENLLVICCNYSFLDRTKDLFKNVKYLFDLIDINDFQYKCFKEASKDALLFLKKIKKQKYLHNILLPSIQEIFYSILMSKAIFKNTIRILNPDSMVVLPYRRYFLIPFHKKFGFAFKSEIFNPVINNLAEGQKDIKIKRIPLFIILFVSPKNIFRFLSFNSFIKFFLNIWKNIFSITEQNENIFKGKNIDSKNQKDKKIFINWGGDLIKHTNLLDLSNELKDLNIVHLFFRKEESRYLSPNHYFYTKKPIRTYFLKNISTFISKSIKAFDDYNFIIKTDSIFEKFNIEELFSTYLYFYLYRTIIIEGYREWLFSIFKLHLPKIFITSDLHHYIGRTFVFTAREIGAKVYTFTHGCPLFVPCIDPIKSLGDKILVSGQGVVTNIRRTGINDYRFNVIGEKKRKISNSFYQSNQKTIVLFTAMKLNSWIYEVKNLNLFFKTIEAIVGQFLNSGFKIIIKSHKLEDYWEFYDKLVEQYKNFPISHIKKRWKLKDLKRCDVAVFPGGISTTILDCQAVGIPVVYIDILSRIEKDVLKYSYQDCGIIVKNAEEAIESINRLFIDKAYLEIVLNLGRQFYKKYIDTKKDFTKELSRVIRF